MTRDDVIAVQKRLAALGLYHDAIDGIFGQHTEAALLEAIAPKGSLPLMQALAPALAVHLPEIGVSTSLRLSHFLAQAAEETDGFRTLVEYASGRAYEGRHDLGNTHPGDGPRYRGRGIFQLTGRANYRAIGAALGLNLETHPDMAAEPGIAVRTACQYWAARDLNRLADADDVRGITRKINGGLNGLDSRMTDLSRAKRALGI